MRQGATMKVTTVRFGVDLWRLLETEAELAGVSVSQYIREAALARASAAVALRGEDPLAALAADAQRPLAADAPRPLAEPAPGYKRSETAAAARQAAAKARSETRATRAEARQAVHQAHQVTEKARGLAAQRNMPAGIQKPA